MKLFLLTMWKIDPKKVLNPSWMSLSNIYLEKIRRDASNADEISTSEERKIFHVKSSVIQQWNEHYDFEKRIATYKEERKVKSVTWSSLFFLQCLSLQPCHLHSPLTKMFMMLGGVAIGATLAVSFSTKLLSITFTSHIECGKYLSEWLSTIYEEASRGFRWICSFCLFW